MEGLGPSATLKFSMAWPRCAPARPSPSKLGRYCTGLGKSGLGGEEKGKILTFVSTVGPSL